MLGIVVVFASTAATIGATIRAIVPFVAAVVIVVTICATIVVVMRLRQPPVSAPGPLRAEVEPIPGTRYARTLCRTTGSPAAEMEGQVVPRQIGAQQAGMPIDVAGVAAAVAATLQYMQQGGMPGVTVAPVGEQPARPDVPPRR